MNDKNSVSTPTAADIKLKIQERIKEAPENWMTKVAALTGKTESTIKNYIYGGRAKKKHLAPVLKSLNQIIDEFNIELSKELSK
jgi:hypothetical protein